MTGLRRAGSAAGAALAVAALLALAEAAAIDLADPWERPEYAFSFAVPRLIVPWILLAVSCLAAAWLARRVRIGRGRLASSLAIHGAAAVAFPIVHLSGVAIVHTIVFGMRDPFVERVRAMLAEYAVQDVLAYCGIVVLVHALAASRRAREQERQATELHAHLAEARLAALRAQLHPHFLFNTLNTAVMLARAGESRKAADVLTDLSALLRGILDRKGHEIALGEEIELVTQYLRIERERFHDRLSVSIRADENVRDGLVPSFILQPLVENAIRYGVASRVERGQVSVLARRDGGELVLEVRDDGPGLAGDEAAHGHGIGLRNTQDRLRQLYGPGASCVVDAGANGVTVQVKLPFRAAGGLAHA